MELLNLIKQRRSVRNFIKNKPIDEKTLNLILEAGIHAPSAGNVQPWHFFVVMKLDAMEKLMKAAYGQSFIAESSCIIVACIDTVQASNRYGERGKNLYAIQDTSAAIQNMLLVAHNFNLGACWVGAFETIDVSKVLNLQPSLIPIALVCIGYPSKITSFVTTRKPLSSVVTWLK